MQHANRGTQPAAGFIDGSTRDVEVEFTQHTATGQTDFGDLGNLVNDDIDRFAVKTISALYILRLTADIVFRREEDFEVVIEQRATAFGMTFQIDTIHCTADVVDVLACDKELIEQRRCGGSVDVLVGRGVLDTRGVGEAAGVSVADGVAVSDGVGVFDGVAVAVAVLVNVAVRVSVGISVFVGVDVAVGVEVGSGVADVQAATNSSASNVHSLIGDR